MNGYGLSLDSMLSSQKKKQQRTDVDISLSEYIHGQQHIQKNSSATNNMSQPFISSDKDDIKTTKCGSTSNDVDKDDFNDKVSAPKPESTEVSTKCKNRVTNSTYMLKNSRSFRLCMYGHLQELEQILTSEETFQCKPVTDNTISVKFHGTSFKADNQKMSLETKTERYRASVRNGISKQMRLLSYSAMYDEAIGEDVGLLKIVLRQMPREIKSNQSMDDQSPWYRISDKENSVAKLVLPIAKEVNRYMNINMSKGFFKGSITMSIQICFIEESDVKVMLRRSSDRSAEFRIFVRGKDDTDEFNVDVTSNDAAVQVAMSNKKQMLHEFGRSFEGSTEIKFDHWKESASIHSQVEQLMTDPEFYPMKQTSFLSSTNMPNITNIGDSDDEEDEVNAAGDDQTEKLIKLIMAAIAVYNNINEVHAIGEKYPRDIDCLVFIIRIFGSRFVIPGKMLKLVQRVSV